MSCLDVWWQPRSAKIPHLLRWNRRQALFKHFVQPLLGAPGLTRSKDATRAPGIAVQTKRFTKSRFEALQTLDVQVLEAIAAQERLEAEKEEPKEPKKKKRKKKVPGSQR